MDVKFRTVEQKDWPFILEIRNQEEVRLSCHDTSRISLEDHIKYMKKIQNDLDVHQWIITYDGQDIGHVKIVHGELGYMIKDGFRGQGIGTKLYEIIIKEAKKIGLKKIYGTIKVDKPIPMKLALKAGFIQRGIIERNGKPYAYQLEMPIV